MYCVNKLTVEEKLEIISKMPIEELEFRRNLILGAINACKQHVEQLNTEIDDVNDSYELRGERYMTQISVGIYRDQLQRINNEIKKRMPKGQPVAINCKVGRMGVRNTKKIGV